MKDGELDLYNHFGGKHRLFSIWFYVHPETGLLCNLRDYNPKGPYPKKARWKKEKEKNKLKKKLGILPEKKPVKKDVGTVYRLGNIFTKGQGVKVNEIYDLEQEHYTARVKILRDNSCIDGQGEIYLWLWAIILECSLEWMKGADIRISKYPRMPYEQHHWALFDKGTLAF